MAAIEASAILDIRYNRNELQFTKEAREWENAYAISIHVWQRTHPYI